MFLTFESVDEILWCDFSNETFSSTSAWYHLFAINTLQYEVLDFSWILIFGILQWELKGQTQNPHFLHFILFGCKVQILSVVVNDALQQTAALYLISTVYRPVYTGNFCAIFVATIRSNFCRFRVASSNSMCKRVAMSVRFGRDLSPRYRSGFEHVRNLMQICGDFSYKVTNSVSEGTHEVVCSGARFSNFVYKHGYSPVKKNIKKYPKPGVASSNRVMAQP